MDVEMGNALTHLVIHQNQAAVCFHGGLDGSRQPLRVREQGSDHVGGKIGEGFVMLFRNHERVSREQGKYVEEGDRDVVLEDGVGTELPGDDPAEGAIHDRQGKRKTMVTVPKNTIVVFSDIACPWAHLAVHRLHETRARLGLEEEVSFDHRAFPLEIFNEQPTPKRILDAEVPVVGGLDPGAGWQMWQGQEHEYPISMLPALEAVQAAKEQGSGASERLDRALRRAFFAESRTITMRDVILDVAASCEGVDERALAAALDDGRARDLITEQKAEADAGPVKGSPHLFLPDGSDVHNPGIEMGWHGEHGKGFPIVNKDDPSIYEALLQRAASR